MARTKNTLASTQPAPAAGAAPPEASPADRPATDTSALPQLPPKKTAPAAKKSLSFQDFINDASSGSDDDSTGSTDGNSRARKRHKQRMLELMPVINLGSQAFSPIGEERPKTPPTPGGAGAKDADAMEEDAKAPAAPADSFGVPPFDIFGDSDDEQDFKDMPKEPATWGERGGCLFPKNCNKEYHMDSDPKGNDPVDNEPCTEGLPDPDPTQGVQHKQPCRLMPKNYKKKPPMHSGSVYNAAELVRSTSTYLARNQSPPRNFTTPEKPPTGIDSLLNKETPLPSFLNDVDTN